MSSRQGSAFVGNTSIWWELNSARLTAQFWVQFSGPAALQTTNDEMKAVVDGLFALLELKNRAGVNPESMTATNAKLSIDVLANVKSERLRVTLTPYEQAQTRLDLYYHRLESLSSQAAASGRSE